MIVDQVLNNNLVSSQDEFGQEVLLMGRGIGWHAHTGEEVDRLKIEKLFRMDTLESTNRLKQLFLEVDVEAIRASTQIIDYAREILRKRLNKNVYITLTDHIGFAAKRLQDGITFRNMLDWEIKKFYPQEFAVGLHGLNIICKTMGVKLPESEAASIAMHIINAEYDCDMEKTLEMTNIIQESLNVVRYTFHIHYDEESLDYQRFVTHMLFFSRRVLENKANQGEKDFIYDMMQNEHPKEFDCACRIRDLVEMNYNVKLSDDEITFLCVHIVRIVGSALRK